MALEWLGALLGDAATPEVEKAIEQEIGKYFVARKDFNDLNGKFKDANARASEVEVLKTAKEAAESKLTEAQQARQNLVKDHAIETALIRANAVNPKAVKALMDLDKVTLDDKGVVVGLQDQLDSLKKTEPWAFQSFTGQLPLSGSPENGTTPATAGTPDDKINQLLRGRAH